MIDKILYHLVKENKLLVYADETIHIKLMEFNIKTTSKYVSIRKDLTGEKDKNGKPIYKEVEIEYKGRISKAEVLMWLSNDIIKPVFKNNDLSVELTEGEIRQVI